VVETGGLENRFTLTGNGGSNPSPSAIKPSKDILASPTLGNNLLKTNYFLSYFVLRDTMRAKFRWGYFRGYVDFSLGVFSQTGHLEGLQWRSLTPKSAKQKPRILPIA
jgi:hypothetical protein